MRMQPFKYAFAKLVVKMESNFQQRFFLSYQKRISLMDVFIILQLSANDFQVRTKEKNNSITRNSSRSDILTLLTLLSVDVKSTVLLRVPLLTKVPVCNFLSLHFSKWLCLVHRQLAVFLRRVKRSVICKCLCFCLFNIQQWSVLS